MNALPPRFLIADATPVSVLSLLGRDGLDLLLATGAELVITDVVVDEVTEEPQEGSDLSSERRDEIAAWIDDCKAAGLLSEMSTPVGRLYRRAMADWRAKGCPPDERPDRTDLGENSIFGVLQALADDAGPDQTTFVLMDEHRGRNIVVGMGLSGVANLDLMGTAAYLRILETDFGIEAAADAWTIIRTTAGRRLDQGVEGDPIRFRRMG